MLNMLSKMSQMIRGVTIVTSLGLFALAFGACQHSEKPRPDVEVAASALRKMNLKQLMDHAVNTSDRQRADIATVLTQKAWWGQAAAITATKLNQKATLDRTETVRLLSLFTLGPSSSAAKVFIASSDQTVPEINKANWLLAAANPSPQMAKMVQKKLSSRLSNQGGPPSVIMPAVAKALAANGIKEAYTLIRTSLDQTDNSDYAHAMASLEPNHASEDFVAYLAKIPVDEIREGVFLHSNKHTCYDILTHLRRYPPAVHHPNFEHLFLFAVSKDKDIANAARNVITKAMPNNEEHLALVLTRLPEPIQTEYLNQREENLSPSETLFFDAVRKNQKF